MASLGFLAVNNTTQYVQVGWAKQNLWGLGAE